MRKIYGASQKLNCPFCEKMATTENGQGFPVCVTHRNTDLDDISCLCGETLEIRKGKYGAFFLCYSCGPQSVKKVLSFAEIKAKGIAVSSPEIKQAPMQRRKPAIPPPKNGSSYTPEEVDIYFS
ncbi:MAG: hypothetical protein ABIH34_06945 [Nanoarchaeota archaeon]